MNNIDSILAADPPRNLKQILDPQHYPRDWPVREAYTASPRDWRDELFYFLLPDRFSNGQERPKRLLDCDLSTPQGAQRIRALRGPDWRWNRWQSSGADLGSFERGGGRITGDDHARRTHRE